VDGRGHRRLLTKLLPRLQYGETINRVVVESRGGSDSLDTRTLGRLRRSRQVTAALRVDHSIKVAEPLLWVADYIAGCWVSAMYHGQPEPWELLDSALVIDVEFL
jgi:hypothetical protein